MFELEPTPYGFLYIPAGEIRMLLNTPKMLTISTTPNVCLPYPMTSFYVMAMVFRIQTQCVANEAEEVFFMIDQIQQNIRTADRFIEKYGATINRMEKARHAVIKRQEGAIRQSEAHRDEYWNRKAAKELWELKFMLVVGAIVLMRMAYETSFFQNVPEPPHPTTPREASPVGRVAQQAPGPDRRRSTRLRRQLRVSRLPQGDSQPTG